MADIVITAAGFISEAGYGDHVLQNRPWPCPPGPLTFSWSDLFASTCPRRPEAGLKSGPCPRFGRMDHLSRLGLAAVELMGVDFESMAPEEKDDVGVVMGTRAGCVSVDAQFWREHGEPGGPSPALFTYTLPSTVMGEICIRHGLKGPNLCVMLGEDDSSVLAEADAWLRSGEADACVCLCCDAVDEAGAAVLGTMSRSFAGALLVEKAGAGRQTLMPLPDGAAGLRETCAALCGFGGE